MVTVRDTIDSIDYDGGDRIEVFNKPTRGFRTLDILENLLYCSNPYSDHVVEINVNNRTTRRFIPFEKGSFPSDVVVMNTSVEIDGKFSVKLRKYLIVYHYFLKNSIGQCIFKEQFYSLPFFFQHFPGKISTVYSLNCLWLEFLSCIFLITLRRSVKIHDFFGRFFVARFHVEIFNIFDMKCDIMRHDECP